MKLTFIDFIYTVPIWSLVLFSFLPLLVKAVSKNKEMRRFITSSIAFMGFLFSSVSLVFLEFKPQFLFSSLLRLDQFSWITTHILVLLSVLTLPLFLSKKNHIVSDKNFSEYIFLFMNSVVGLILLVWSNNLLASFIAVEHFSLCFYLMIPLARDRMSSIESGLKYFVLGSTAGVIFLLGIALIYIAMGSLNFSILFSQSEILSSISPIFLLGFALICLAVLFKVSIFPFQFWLPDVYQASATPLAGFMAGAVKASVFVFLLKFIFFGGFVSQGDMKITSLLEWLAVLSFLVGHISALTQKNLKRLLIYSSIAHAGYIITALLNPSLFSVSSLIYYIVFYGVINFGALTFVMFFEGDKITGMEIQDLSGLYKTHPFYAVIFSWFLLNLAGLPPTAGFFAKFFIFESLVQKSKLWLLFWAVIGSALALYYYLKPLVVMYSDSSNQKPIFKNNIWMTGCFIAQFIISIVLMIFVGGVHEWIVHFWLIEK